LGRGCGGVKGLYYVRKKLGLTQSELGDRVGIDPNTISRYEREQLNATNKTAMKIAQKLGVSVDELLRGPAEKRWEVRVILEEPKEVDVMILTKDAPNEALVEIGTHKIAVKIVGDVENESELDNLLAEVKEKALDGLGLKRKWREAAAQ